MPSFRTTLLIALIGLAPVPGDAADVAAGRGGFAVCEACHGLKGEGIEALGAPRLVGLEPWYFARQFANFRNGTRGARPDDERGQQMRAIASGVEGDAALDDLIAYVGTLEAPPAVPSVKGDPVRGRQQFQLCVACHGPEGRGNAALGAPALAGRSDWYLLRQLADFRSGRRGAGSGDAFGAQMQGIASALADDAALEDVVAYIAALPAVAAAGPATGWALKTTCPPSFERLADETCVFRSLYDFYASAGDHGGLRVALPPERAAYPARQIDLGRYLFFDPLLSADRRMSCASCHHPDHAYADGRGRSIGAGGVTLARGAPSLWNVGFLRQLFWDGRAHSLEEQAAGPLFSADEMGNTLQGLVSALNANVPYRSLFASAFGRDAGTPITAEEIERALAAFESSLVSFSSRYDRYAHGDVAALSPLEIEGHNVFRGFVARCSQCHTPPLFTDSEVAVVGAPPVHDADYDRGAGAHNADPAEQGAFRVPTLRNVALTAPYFQAGQLASLDDVVHFYNDTRGHAVPAGVPLQIHWHIAMSAPELSKDDEQALVAFLGALTDESMKPPVPAAVPSGLPVISHSNR